PDLRISLVDRPNWTRFSQDNLFIECKPVDTKHPVVTHYCDKGIVRFVRGDYAWAMTEALMIGYVRNGYTISSKLEQALKARMNEISTLIFPCPCPKSEPAQNNEVVHISSHSRTFPYQNGQQAPAITIRHRWLKRD
ncbi:MAG: hypothetical protein ACYC9O_18720, partial [Candidatus Latescibacterota bacterium]